MTAARGIKSQLLLLYEGRSKRAARFHYMLLSFDVATIAFLIVSTFFHDHPLVVALDVLFGLYILADLSARLWISKGRLAFILNPLNIADGVAMLSFLIPLLADDFAFLRAVRVLRLLRSYRLLNRLRGDFHYFRQNEDIIISTVNLLIFIFLMTELVFVTQVKANPDVNNFLDAMYFTVTALTTTGFGDITLQGKSGRVLSIIVMIVGVGLFLHDRDAIHCKHCGQALRIASEGAV